MTAQPKKKETYRPQKTISQYTDTEIIAALNNSHLISELKLAPICAEILKRMNQKSPLLPERTLTSHRGPIC